jgi:hypothetical protein
MSEMRISLSKQIISDIKTMKRMDVFELKKIFCALDTRFWVFLSMFFISILNIQFVKKKEKLFITHAPQTVFWARTNTTKK